MTGAEQEATSAHKTHNMKANFFYYNIITKNWTANSAMTVIKFLRFTWHKWKQKEKRGSAFSSMLISKSEMGQN